MSNFQPFNTAPTVTGEGLVHNIKVCFNFHSNDIDEICLFTCFKSLRNTEIQKFRLQISHFIYIKLLTHYDMLTS